MVCTFFISFSSRQIVRFYSTIYNLVFDKRVSIINQPLHRMIFVFVFNKYLFTLTLTLEFAFTRMTLDSRFHNCRCVSYEHKHIDLIRWCYDWSVLNICCRFYSSFDHCCCSFQLLNEFTMIHCKITLLVHIEMICLIWRMKFWEHCQWENMAVIDSWMLINHTADSLMNRVFSIQFVECALWNVLPTEVFLSMNNWSIRFG